MTKAQLYEALDYVDATREKRTRMANLVCANPDLVFPLLEICFKVDDPVSSKACWILEFTVKKNFKYLFPHLNFFTDNLGKVHLDSSVRPLAKICELLIKSYFHKTSIETKSVLTNDHLENITAACFDWIIGEHKVATKAYSMASLFLLGKKYDWIHSELKVILNKNYASGSSGYKARARKILNSLP